MKKVNKKGKETRMMKVQRAQRPTLTYSQMYGRGDAAGIMEGRGIFSKLGKLIKRGVKGLGGIIKREKLISKGLSLAGTTVGAIPGIPSKAASIGLKLAAEIAKQKGFGLPKKVKALSRNQIESILRGFARQLSGGGVSLAAAKFLFPRIKNITPTQMRALAAFRGRLMAGGGVSLAGGRASHKPMSGMGFSGMGVKLAGQGTGLAGGRAIRLAGGRIHRAPPGFVLKKKVRRKRTTRF